jgi:hypothetical protein
LRFRRLSYHLVLGLLGALFVAPAWLAGREPAAADAATAAMTSSDPVVFAAGDIACDPRNTSFNGGLGSATRCRHKYTSDLIVKAGASAVLLLGDNQYHCGAYRAWLRSYDPTWGRFKAITRPAIGNHEYLTHGTPDCEGEDGRAPGYFRYFGPAAGDPRKGYYSYDIGAWHLIVLNSQCGEVGGCGPTSFQGQWLAQDLALHANRCTLAYWHIPLFSSGGRASDNTRPFWDLLHAAGADLVLTGHDHLYERFAKQRPDGTRDPARGLRQFVVGTGGANHTRIPGAIQRNSQVREESTFGVLRLTLRPASYDWKFVPEAGKTFTDAGTTRCHGAEPPVAGG